MKKYLILLLITASHQVFAGAPKIITVQESFGSKLTLTLPEIELPETCTTTEDKCNFEVLTTKRIQIGNSTYNIQKIFTEDYEQGMTWEQIYTEKRIVSIRLVEVDTTEEYTIYINWSDVAPCLVGKTFTRDAKLHCVVTEKY